MPDVPWSLLEPPPGASPPASLRLELLDDDAVSDRSYGPITKPETVNYRTLRPERDGLFCEQTFGPAPGDLRESMFEFSKQLEPWSPPMRATRFGHVQLSVPLVHPLYLEHQREALAADLDLDVQSLERVVAFEAHLVIDPGSSELRAGEVLDDGAQWPADATVATGAPAIAALHEEAWGDSPIFLRQLPVLPPDLRPLVPLDGGRFATSDLNDLYRRVINRNNRNKRLMELNAPEIILRNEQRMLQESANALFLNRNEPVIKGPESRPLRSLWDLLGLGRSPWERLLELDERVRADPRALEHELDGPRHWFLCHLTALRLTLEPDV